MTEIKGFYTLKGYQINETGGMTTSMQDYLEMICRLTDGEPDVVRVRELAFELHVKPSSVSKMVGNLREAGCVEYKKYGYISVTDKGKKIGAYLLWRHRVLHDFLCMLNGTEDELEQVEKIEHFIDERTTANLAVLTKRLREEKDAGSDRPETVV